jgi:tetratricopeptide (TPR) repeat protein
VSPSDNDSLGPEATVPGHRNAQPLGDERAATATTPPPAQAEPRAGPEQIGHYVLERPLGRGGMGEVFLAWDARLERHVAFKRIRGDRAMDPQRRARFRREARAIARLSHPVIVQIYDLVDTDDGEGIVMEYVEGTSLARMLAGARAGLDIGLAIALAAELADGLAQAHAKGILHRDLKAENVMVTTTGHAKLLDFGLAYRLAEARGEKRGAGGSSDALLTESGVLVGTAHAMSPEQARGGALDHRSDLFTLGGVIYAMLTGHPPFAGADLIDTLHRITSEPVVAVGERRAGVPAELGALVEQLLAKDPAARPSGAQEVARTLDRLARAHRPAVGAGRAGGAELALAADELAALSTASAIEGAPAPRSPPGGERRAAAAAAASAHAGNDAPEEETGERSGAPARLQAVTAAASNVVAHGMASAAAATIAAAPPRQLLPRWLAPALALCLALALGLVWRGAYQARDALARERAALAQSERRRQQAEALLPLLLVDLRQRLEPLGELAVLRTAGDRIAAYFAAAPERALSLGELGDRATALHQIAQVRLAQGELAPALAAFREALRHAEQLVQRDPGSSEGRFELGQRYFWVGFVLWQQKQLIPALEPLRAYLRLSEELVTRDPRNRSWMLELAYAHSNLGSLHRELGALPDARSALGAAAGLMETLRAQAPDDDALLLELAHVQAKLGDILVKQGELAAARPWFERYLEALHGLTARAPGDLQRLRFLGYAHSHLGNLQRWTGELDGALAHFRDDLAIAERLATHAPDDLALADELALRLNKVADLLLVRGERGQAKLLLERERALVAALLSRDPAHPPWRLAQARCELTFAALLEAQGAIAPALARAHAATVILQELVLQNPDVQSIAVWSPYAWWRLGRLQARAGNEEQARAAWQQGLAQSAVLARHNDEPRLRDVQARLALGLGRGDQARPLLEGLERIGYREPELMAMQRELAAAPRQPTR